MAVFYLSSVYPENDESIKSRVGAHGGDSYDVGRGQWLIAFNGTSQELYDELFPDNAAELPKTGGVIVTAIGGYWGRATTNLWEWIAAKKEASKSA